MMEMKFLAMTSVIALHLVAICNKACIAMYAVHYLDRAVYLQGCINSYNTIFLLWLIGQNL